VRHVIRLQLFKRLSAFVYGLAVRELAPDLSLRNFLDFCVYLLSSLLSTIGLPNFWEKRRETFIASSVEKKYQVKFIYKNFPPDLFWKDNLQRVDFLPTKKIVIEVGAYIGVFAIVAAKFYQADKVIAIEPDKESFSYLLKNVQINQCLDNRVMPLNLAAYNTDGEIALFKSGPYLTTKRQGNPQRVLAKRLDSLIDELKLHRVDLLTVDVEGSEVDVLKGATLLLSKHKPQIIIEVHSKQLKQEVIKLLSSFGYHVVHEKIIFRPHISVLYFKFFRERD